MARHLPIALTGLLLSASTSLGQICEVRLLASDGALGDQFGADVHLDGGVALIGAQNDAGSGGGPGHGAVYVNTLDAATGVWVETGRLQPAGLNDRSFFGSSIDRDGDRLVVGAPGDIGALGTQPGEAFVYVTADGGLTWSLEAVLAPSDGAARDGFGGTVAIDGDLILVGAESNDEGGNNAGAVYAFGYDGVAWTQTAKELPPSGVGGVGFGESVSLDGGLACLGGGSLSSGSQTGVVATYLVDAAGDLTFLELSQPSGLGIADFYGASTALEGGLLVAGASFDDDQGGNAGAAYIFRFDPTAMTFVLEDKVTSSSPVPQGRFGIECATDGSTVVVGASGLGAWSFLQSGSSWVPARFALPESVTSSTVVGEALAVDGDLLLMGDDRDRSVGFQVGASFLVNLSTPDLNGNGVNDLCESLGTIYCSPAIANSTGTYAKIEAGGSPFATDQLLALTTTDLPSFSFGYYLGSQTQGLVAGPGGSQGTLCLGGTIGRFISQVTDSGSAGQITIQVNLGALPPPLPTMVQAGESWNFQLWYRDVNPTVTSNFSDAVEIQYL